MKSLISGVDHQSHIVEPKEEVLKFSDTPNGGYGWIIVVSGFFISFMIDGMFTVFGVLLPVFIQYFAAGSAETVVIGSLLTAFLLLSGPLVSAMIHCMGCRLVAMLGGCLLTLGLLLSTIAPSIPILAITFGFISGCGLGMIYLPSVVVVSNYFDSKRSLANGLSTAGSGIGMLVMGPLTSYMVLEFGWKGALFYVAGITLQTVVFAALLRPIPSCSITQKRQHIETDSECLRLEPNVFEDLEPIPECSIPSIDATEYVVTDISSLDNDRSPGVLLLEKKYNITKLEPVYEENTDETKGFTNESTAENQYPNSPQNKALHKSEVKERFATEEHTRQNTSSCMSHDLPDKHKQHKILRPAYYSCLEIGNRNRPDGLLPNYHCHGFHKPTPKAQSLNSSCHYLPSSLGVLRPDLFYTLSLSHLPEAQQVEFTNTLSKTALELQTAEKSRMCLCCSKSICVLLQKFLNVAMLKNPTFMLMALSNMFLQVGSSVASMFLVDYGQTIGLEATLAASLTSIFGISNTIGRLLGGVLALYPRVNVLYLTGLSIMASGACCLFCTNSGKGYEVTAVGAATVGFFLGPSVPLTPVLVVNYMGLQNLSNAFGLLSMFKGIFTLVGVPIAGLLLDVTSDYLAPYMYACVLLMLSGAVHFLYPMAERCQQRRLV